MQLVRLFTLKIHLLHAFLQHTFNGRSLGRMNPNLEDHCLSLSASHPIPNKQLASVVLDFKFIKYYKEHLPGYCLLKIVDHRKS